MFTLSRKRTLKKESMATLKSRGKDIIPIGYPQGTVISIAIDGMLRHYKRDRNEKIIQRLKTILAHLEILDSCVFRQYKMPENRQSSSLFLKGIIT